MVGSGTSTTSTTAAAGCARRWVRERNRSFINKHLIPQWGKLRVDEISVRHVDDFILYLRKCGMKPSTVNRGLAIARKMFSDGISWGYLLENPIHKKFLPVREQPFDYLSSDETSRLLAHCQGEFWLFVKIAVYTGMRRGEILNLRKNDISLEKRTIVVREGKGGRTRYIPIHADLCPELKNLTGDRIFEHSHTWYFNQFKNALRQAGLRSIRLHDLRHTFASNFIMSGGNILVLQKILGHRDLKQTLRYSHLAPDYLGTEIEKLSYRHKLGTVKENGGAK